MGLFDERIAYKPFEYPEYYTGLAETSTGILVTHRNINAKRY